MDGQPDPNLPVDPSTKNVLPPLRTKLAKLVRPAVFTCSFPVIVGDERTYVDAYSVPMVRWASSMLPGGLDAWPSVKAHHERMLADDGVRRAMVDEGLVES